MNLGKRWKKESTETNWEIEKRRSKENMIDDVAANSPSNTTDETAENQHQEKPWHSYIYKDLPRMVRESADSAVRSARSLQQNSSTHIRTLKDHVVQYTAQYRSYEDLVFSKIKDQLTIVREHPTLSAGIAITAALLFMRVHHFLQNLLLESSP
uniref:Uncharacterized protein n=1 Tax=Lactuca sativa TaxID=4236 RepID=A0A9R1W0E1_LACSA|nr:hypothetical protein LSAT_V11C300129890 [Lactuca sativa]